MLKNFSRSNNWFRKKSLSTSVTTSSLAGKSAATIENEQRIFHSTLAPRSSCLHLLTNCSSTCFLRTMSGEAQSPPHAHTNRLGNEKSPYLRQHAHNPVNWYPWGNEAIEKAREEKKLIFLSVGYSTCHWCHVMEKESFENEAVAAVMNEHFINIKVDREERPDIDKIYMQFLLLVNGSGGWPMSVWLTPDLAPVTAGTYFPPKSRYGMPSFTAVLTAVAEKWASNQERLRNNGLEVITTIQKSMSEKASGMVFDPDSCEAKLQETVHIFKQRYDQEHGGFGTKPKFPEIPRLNLLFHAYICTKDADLLDMALQTLTHMGHGGIHDHVFGGFCRYSVDRKWHVPHFEKMLYDQGQLISAYAHAYKITSDKKYLFYADSIFQYLMKDLHHPSGGFYSGEDADSLPNWGDTDKIEGAFYVWGWSEVKNTIEANMGNYEGLAKHPVFDIYAHHYCLKPQGNVDGVNDPHGHFSGKNILIIRGSEEETCKKFKISPEDFNKILELTNKALLTVRNNRPRPHLDTKIISAWNGLVLSGLSKLSNCEGVKREQYLQAAKELVAFIRDNLFDKERKLLQRACYGLGTDDSTLESITSERINGFLDDYAFVIRGLLDYYKSSLDDDVLLWAKELQDIQNTLFWDEEHGAYFYSEANSPNVVVRLKENHDGAEPSGNSVSARNLILLSHYFDEESYRQQANQLLKYFANVDPFGYTLPEMMSALLLEQQGLNLIAVVGPESAATQQFKSICCKFFIPGMIIWHVDPHNTNAVYGQRAQSKFKMLDGRPTVYICHDRSCRMPVTDPQKLEENLRENFFQNRICATDKRASS